MKKSSFKIIMLLGLFFMTTKVIAQNATNIQFKVSFSQPQAHYADVQMTIANINKDELLIKMPVWTPGSYLVREFAKNIETVEVCTDKGTPIAFEKVTKNAWKINTKGKKNIVVNYKVYAFEISVRTSFIDINHAFLSPTGIFMYPEGSLAEPALVQIMMPKIWTKVSTGLTSVANQPFTYYAKNFDCLFDSPIEVGNQDIFEFTAANVKHEVAMVGGGNYDKEKLKIDMAKIIEQETSVFGENPNENYVFIVHHFLNGGGGLEHQNSTVLGASRMGYDNEKSYKDFLSLVAHEYFHLWNVKRLRPIALGPFDYDNENYTTNLWIAEGFTAYYDNLIVQRTGNFTDSEFLGILTSDINLIYNQPGSKIQSVSDASFDAWIKYYRPNENSNNTSISYYNKGSLIAALLDLAIIKHSNGTQSLDDAMKFAYTEYHKKKGRGYTDAEFKLIFERFAGENLDQFYKDYIKGTATLDFQKYLDYAGLKLVEEAQYAKSISLGITFDKDKNTVIKTVSRGSAAWNDGLNVNDEILAINGKRATEISNAISKYKVNDQLEFLISRDGILQTIKVTLKASQVKNFSIQKQTNPTAIQKSVYEKWLRH